MPVFNGTSGNDYLIGAEQNDEIYGFAGDDVLEGREGNDSLFGGDGADGLAGGIGDDYLDGGTGGDWMDGWTGNDTYVVDNMFDDVLEEPNSGTDTVHASVSFSLISEWGGTLHVENLTLTGGADISGWGDGYANILTGNSGANGLYGGGGDDQIFGGDGDDLLRGNTGDDLLDGGAGTDTATYEWDESGVVVSLATTAAQNTGGGGIDTLSAIENLVGSGFADLLTGNSGANTLSGLGGNDRLYGNAGDDRLYGGDGNDILEGGAGVNSLNGGIGNDTASYSSATAAVVVSLAIGTAQNTGGAGVDTLTSVERLAGSEHGDRLTGNDGANMLAGAGGDDRLYGNAGNDSLDGGAGVDRMYGGTGNDTYAVRDSSDYVYEFAGEGTDTAEAWITHTLRANVENLNLMGTANLNGSGNALANIISGNSGANRLYGLDGDDRLYGREGNDRLDGGAGVDRLYGGPGSDIYYVTDSTDYIYEYAGEGTDSVYASVSHSLRANVERLYLTGTAATNGTGNELANLITGNGAANLLRGLAGNDVLKGAGGNDRIEGGAGGDSAYGGSGADQFAFRDGDFAGATTRTAELIHDFSQADGDRLNLDLVDANTGVIGRQNFTFIGTSAFSGTAGELRYQQTSGYTFVSGDTNGDGVADFLIRLTGVHTLTTGDFVF